MSRGRAGVISKEYKGEENTELHDIIKLFKIYRVVNWQMQIKINQVSVMLSLMYQANHRSSNYWLRKETNIFSVLFSLFTQSTLKEIFDYLRQSGRECYLAIDEFQQIMEYPEKGVEGLLRSYIQFLPNVHFIFSGSKKHLMEYIFFSIKRPFYQSTPKLFLDKISKEVYFSFAHSFFEKEGKELPEEIFDKVYTWVDGHTWYVQYLLNRLFALPEKTLSPELLDSLMMEILREEEYTYQTYFQLLTFNQIQLLKAIAKEGIVREVNAAAFIKKYDLKAVSSVNTSLRILIDKEFILRQPDGYIVYDRFMSIWLSRI